MANYHLLPRLFRCHTPLTTKEAPWHWLEMRGGERGEGGEVVGWGRTLFFPKLASMGFTCPDLARFYSVYEAHLEFANQRPRFYCVMSRQN